MIYLALLVLFAKDRTSLLRVCIQLGLRWDARHETWQEHLQNFAEIEAWPGGRRGKIMDTSGNVIVKILQ